MSRKNFVIFCENGHKIRFHEDNRGNFILPKECPEPGCSVSLIKFQCPCCRNYHKPDERSICPGRQMDICEEIRRIKLISKFEKDKCVPLICFVGILISRILFFLIVGIAAIAFSPSPETQPLWKWGIFLGSLMIPVGGFIGFHLKKKRYIKREFENFIRNEAPDLLPNFKKLNMYIHG